MPMLVVVGCGLGEASMGMTAGSGIDGAGDTDRWDENDERRLWLTTLGGFMGKANDVGVPGAEGAGELIEVGPEAAPSMAASCDR